MEARVWSGTGLLPEALDMVVLHKLDDGRWEAQCLFDHGEPRGYRYAANDDAEVNVASTLRQDLGFAPWCADETARRLFEPFAMAADWPW